MEAARRQEKFPAWFFFWRNETVRMISRMAEQLHQPNERRGWCRIEQIMRSRRPLHTHTHNVKFSRNSSYLAWWINVWRPVIRPGSDAVSFQRLTWVAHATGKKICRKGWTRNELEKRLRTRWECRGLCISFVCA
ncbi:hypothetical protein, unlikely [Trypanosoma brucei brucei TREU927]|uniref:Uncharacterized protein n=1 Tax=Trypanosoma brucei brucei (strain 927/4 GUTat10.1) TaxID=185431 RepID=Q38FK0_TRYB2|nr:hypothetical protein, unlikely [Trypanosoma brucei brucei TREU927]EAN76420.1 hypothetical protein, unlikely [Trypanosoma brucei brucei TREU927]